MPRLTTSTPFVLSESVKISATPETPHPLRTSTCTVLECFSELISPVAFSKIFSRLISEYVRKIITTVRIKMELFQKRLGVESRDLLVDLSASFYSSVNIFLLLKYFSNNNYGLSLISLKNGFE